MGKIGVFVILFVLIFSLAFTPIIFDNSFAGGPVIVPPEDCKDGIDNDGDGLVDFNDPNCFVILFPAPGALPELPGFPNDPDPNVTPQLGDFKCYLVGNPGPDEKIRLLDQFQDEEYTVRGVIEICNTVIKQAEDEFDEGDIRRYDESNTPVISNQHFKVYDIGRLNEPLMVDVLLQDQWGTTRHDFITPIELWVPQEKNHLDCREGFYFDPSFPPQFQCRSDDPGADCSPPYSPAAVTPPFCTGPADVNPQGTMDTDIHWKCYSVLPQTPNAIFDVSLEDQNFGDSLNDVMELHKICTPVKKSRCMPGYDFNLAGKCQEIGGGATIDPVMTGDDKLNDHLKCYRIADSKIPLSFEFVGAEYIGQFGQHVFPTPFAEWEVCLVANKIHVPENSIGGSFIPIDTTSLLLAASYTTASWLIPVVISVAGLGIVLSRKTTSKKE